MTIGDKVIAWIIEHPMVLVAVLLLYVLLLSGCGRRVSLDLGLLQDDVYTRAEVDAIQSEMQCKQTARTQLEIARCIGNRRGP